MIKEQKNNLLQYVKTNGKSIEGQLAFLGEINVFSCATRKCTLWKERSEECFETHKIVAEKKYAYFTKVWVTTHIAIKKLNCPTKPYIS